MSEHVYHVVCRDCPTESLRRSRAGAARLADDHARTADHDVAVARVE